MFDAMVEIITGLLTIILGWLGVTIRTLNNRVNELEKHKADNTDLEEIKSDLKEILNLMTQIRIEQGIWRGTREREPALKKLD